MIDNELLLHIQRNLKKNITSKRYRHTIGVMNTAVSMAMRYDIDFQQAALAGLLHDCAKCLDDDEMLRQCEKYNITCNKTERKQPYLLHAKLGAFYAAEKYGIKDDEVSRAIRYHTTGRPGMSLLEEIIFTADYIEPNRKMLEHLPVIRKMAFIDLEEAVYMILRDTVDYLGKNTNKTNQIENHTLEAYEYYKRLHEEKTAATYHATYHQKG